MYVETLRPVSMDFKNQNRAKILELSSCKKVELLNAIALNDVFPQLTDVQKDNLFYHLANLASFMDMTCIRQTSTFAPMIEKAAKHASGISLAQQRGGLPATIEHILSNRSFVNDIGNMIQDAPKNVNTKRDLLDMMQMMGIVSQDKVEQSVAIIDSQQKQQECADSGVKIHVADDAKQPTMSTIDRIVDKMYTPVSSSKSNNKAEMSESDIKNLFGHDQPQTNGDDKTEVPSFGNIIADMLVSSQLEKESAQISNIFEKIVNPQNEVKMQSVFRHAMAILNGQSENPTQSMATIVEMVQSANNAKDTTSSDVSSSSSINLPFDMTVQPITYPLLDVIADCQDA